MERLSPEDLRVLAGGTSSSPVVMEMQRAASMPPARQDTSHSSLPLLTRGTVEAPVVSVRLCFYAPRGAHSSSTLGQWIHWWTTYLQEQYTHVECLFELNRPEADPTRWVALTVSERERSGMYKTEIGHYRDGRWFVMKLVNLTVEQRAALYNFAVCERQRKRSYNYAAIVNNGPASCCAPVVRYTPCCVSCVPSGPKTVYCVQLMLEMLATVFPGRFDDIQSDRYRPDQFLALVSHRMQWRWSQLVLESEQQVDIERAMLRGAGANLSEPPRVKAGETRRP